MSKAIEGNRFTERCDAAIAKYLRVKYAGDGRVTVCGDAQHIGTLDQLTLAANELATIRSIGGWATHIGVAAGAIAKGAIVKSAAAGKCQTGAGTISLGVCRTPAAADGDLVEYVNTFGYDLP